MSKKQKQSTSKIYYTADEAGEILRRSTWSIRHDCKAGRIPSRRIGRRFLIPRSYFFPPDLFPNRPAGHTADKQAEGGPVSPIDAAKGATYATTTE